MATQSIFGSIPNSDSYNLVPAWSERSDNDDKYIAKIASSGGKWVAVGGESGAVAYSEDGSSWTKSTVTDEGVRLNAVAFGNGKWRAVGEYGLAFSSENGTDWYEDTSMNNESGNELLAVLYAGDVWIAAGAAGAVGIQSDGWYWGADTKFGSNESILGLAYGQARWVAVGTSGKMSSATDPFEWTSVDAKFGFSTIRDVAYSNGLWVAVGDHGKISTSVDGIKWVKGESAFFKRERISKIVRTDGRWVAISSKGKISVSIDGHQWVTHGTINFFGNPWVAYGDIVTVYTPPPIDTDPEEPPAPTQLVISWRDYNDNNPENYWSVNANPVIKAIGDIQSGYHWEVKWMSGSDGTLRPFVDGEYTEEPGSYGGPALTFHTMHVQPSEFERAYSSGIGVVRMVNGSNLPVSNSLVIVISDSTGEGMAYESIGTYVTLSELPDTRVNLIGVACYDVPNSTPSVFLKIKGGYKTWPYLQHIIFGDGSIAMVGGNAYGARSTTGAEWEMFLLPERPHTIAYGNGVYVALGDSTGAYTSADGLNWIEGTLKAEGGNLWSDITYGNDVFLAVGSERYAISEDGLTWQQYSFFIQTNPNGQSSNYDYVGGNKKVVFTGGKFFLTGLNGFLISWNAIKPEGEDNVWTLMSMPGPVYSPLGVANEKLIRFNPDASTIWVSSDVAATWSEIAITALAPPNTAILNRIVYQNGIYVATASDYITRDRVFVSTDLVEWTPSMLPNTIRWPKIGAGAGIFLVCNEEGDVSQSADGYTWSAVVAPFSGIPTVVTVTHQNESVSTYVGTASPNYDNPAEETFLIPWNNSDTFCYSCPPSGTLQITYPTIFTADQDLE